MARPTAAHYKAARGCTCQAATYLLAHDTRTLRVGIGADRPYTFKVLPRTRDGIWLEELPERRSSLIGPCVRLLRSLEQLRVDEERKDLPHPREWPLPQRLRVADVALDHRAALSLKRERLVEQPAAHRVLSLQYTRVERGAAQAVGARGAQQREGEEHTQGTHACGAVGKVGNERGVEEARGAARTAEKAARKG
eukprot:scaffold190043_cov30-Tisochrysis_lutea.AAC.3